MKSRQEGKIHKEGETAHKNGLGIDSNPYKDGSIENWLWSDGWNNQERLEILVKKMNAHLDEMYP